jgi:hypothetical protein
MKYIFIISFLFVQNFLFAQSQRSGNEFIREQARDMLVDANYVEQPPLFAFGKDSLQNFYFSHFKGYDSVLTKCIANGDTVKYIRIYFSFVVDKEGKVFDAKFERVASTRYSKSDGAKTIKYFDPIKKYLNQVVQQIFDAMPLWKPALQYHIPVDCKMRDYMQFWVGLHAPN